MVSEVHPSRMLGVLTGSAIALWCFGFAGALLWRGLAAEIELPVLGAYLASAFFFGLGCLFAYWTYCCLMLRYHLDRNGLTIYWGNVRQLIPMDRIERLVPGRELAPPKVSGVSWLGHHAGHGDVEGLGNVIFYSTHRTHEELLYIVTPTQTYAISVPDEAMFAEDLQGHQRMGQVISLPQVTERHAIAALSFWYDPRAQLLALAAILAYAVMLGYVFHEYPRLPASIPLAFPSLGGITRIDSKTDLLTIPVTGIGLLAANLVLGFFLHAWERSVSYLLFAAAICAQFMLLAAVVVTLHQ